MRIRASHGALLAMCVACTGPDAADETALGDDGVAKSTLDAGLDVDLDAGQICRHDSGENREEAGEPECSSLPADETLEATAYGCEYQTMFVPGLQCAHLVGDWTLEAARAQCAVLDEAGEGCLTDSLCDRQQLESVCIDWHVAGADGEPMVGRHVFTYGTGPAGADLYGMICTQFIGEEFHTREDLWPATLEEYVPPPIEGAEECES